MKKKVIVMSRLVKIVDNKYVQIEEYKNSNICFNTNEYDDFENYCTLRKRFDPFEMFYENQELKKQLEEYKATNKILSHELTKDKVLQQDCLTTCCGIPIGDIPKLITQQKEFIKYLEDESKEIYRDGGLRQNIYKEVLKKYKEIIGE
jgi:hypothetical protein